MRDYIKKISTYAMVGSIGAAAMVALTGCEQRPQSSGDTFTQASQKQGAFVVIDEVAPNRYKIAEEYPSDTTRVILRKLDGSEKILSQEELDALVAQEARRIDSGESALTQPNSGGGLSLGEALLASAAGAIIGSWIGSKLFNNPNYQQNRQRSYKSPSAYNRSVNSFNKAKQAKSSSSAKSTRSGFFGSTRSGSSSRSTFGS